MVITGKGRADVSETCASRLADVLTISVEHRGHVTLIDWPKFSEFQGYESQTRVTSPPFQPRSASASRDPRIREEEEKSAAPAATRRKASREPMPEGFPSAEYRAELMADFPDLAADDAIDEFLAYAEREGATYIGERGWKLALRGSLLRAKGRGLFRARASPASRLDARAAELADIARQATALRDQRERQRAEDHRADSHVRRLRSDADAEPPRNVPGNDRSLLAIAASRGDP